MTVAKSNNILRDSFVCKWQKSSIWCRLYAWVCMLRRFDRKNKRIFVGWVRASMRAVCLYHHFYLSTGIPFVISHFQKMRTTDARRYVYVYAHINSIEWNAENVKEKEIIVTIVCDDDSCHQFISIILLHSHRLSIAISFPTQFICLVEYWHQKQKEHRIGSNEKWEKNEQNRQKKIQSF